MANVSLSVVSPPFPALNSGGFWRVDKDANLIERSRDLENQKGPRTALQHLNGPSPFLGLAWALTIVVCEPHRHEFGMSRAQYRKRV